MTKSREELLKELEKIDSQDEATVEVKDNRYRLEVDEKNVESWELGCVQSGMVNDWLLLFPRYLVNGNGLVSPGLPTTPIDELTPKELKQIKKSKAYKIVKRFKTPVLKDAAEAFSDRATASFQ